MADTAPKHPRPLSPHLQAYRLPMTAKMSITHRMTGVILLLGSILVATWLIAAALGPDYYDLAMMAITHPLGLIVMVGWSAAFYYHLCNGIRHLFWDMGYLFKLKNARASGWLVLAATVLLTAMTWWCAGNYAG